MTNKIKGARDLKDNEVQMLNVIQEFADDVGDLITGMTEDSLEVSKHDESDEAVAESLETKRWIEAAELQLQVGFMMLRRAVTRHTRF